MCYDFFLSCQASQTKFHSKAFSKFCSLNTLQIPHANSLTSIWFPTLISKVFMLLVQMLNPLMVVMFICPGAVAVQSEHAFPDIPFKAFNTFVEQNFSSKIMLTTVLMLLFTITENTDLLNLHQQQQHLQLSDENKVNLSSWIKSLGCEVQKQTTGPKFKTQFKKSETLNLIPDNQVITIVAVQNQSKITMGCRTENPIPVPS